MTREGLGRRKTFSSCAVLLFLFKLFTGTFVTFIIKNRKKLKLQINVLISEHLNNT